MKNLKFIVPVILIVIVIGLVIYNNYISTKLSDSDHNLKVAMDSVQVLTLKNGEQVSTINSYILEKDQLQQYLDVSKEEVKELEKRLGKISYISNIKTEVVYDSICTIDTIYRDNVGNISYNISYTDEWLKLRGKSNIINKLAITNFDTISINTPLQVGLTNDYRIWVKSKNPYLKINDIEGAVIEGSRINQKQKKFGLGLSLGYGLQYNDKKIQPGPYIGVGLNYNLISF